MGRGSSGLSGRNADTIKITQTLTGTEKQIAWAKDILENAASSINTIRDLEVEKWQEKIKKTRESLKRTDLTPSQMERRTKSLERSEQKLESARNGYKNMRKFLETETSASKIIEKRELLPGRGSKLYMELKGDDLHKWADDYKPFTIYK